MILHITTLAAWQKAQAEGDYGAEAVATEGFIHCSTAVQVLTPANALFRGQNGLVLLCLDPAQLTAPLVYEDCYESGEQFPHLYGRLNLEAVTAVIPFPPNPDGTFSLPAEIHPS